MRENVNLDAGRRKYIIHEISHVSDNKTNMHVFRVKFFVEQAIQYENQCLGTLTLDVYVPNVVVCLGKWCPCASVS